TAGCDGCSHAGGVSQQQIASGTGSVHFSPNRAYMFVGREPQTTRTPLRKQPIPLTVAVSLSREISHSALADFHLKYKISGTSRRWRFTEYLPGCHRYFGFILSTDSLTLRAFSRRSAVCSTAIASFGFCRRSVSAAPR